MSATYRLLLHILWGDDGSAADLVERAKASMFTERVERELFVALKQSLSSAGGIVPAALDRLLERADADVKALYVELTSHPKRSRPLDANDIDDLLVDCGVVDHHVGLVTPRASELAFAGPLGEIAIGYAPYTEAAPIAILGVLLAMVGNMIGRSAHQLIDGARHGCNLFVVLVGSSGDGRKGTAVSRARAIVRMLDDEYARSNAQSGLSTGQGLIARVRDGGEHGVADDDGCADPGISDKRLLVIEDELASALRQMRGRENTLSTVLRSAWDGAQLQTMTRRDPLRATDAHISIVGQISPPELRALVSDTDFENGLLNRFIWVHTERSQFLPFADGGVPACLASSIVSLKSNIRGAMNVGSVGLTDEAVKWWTDNYRALTLGGTGRVGQLSRRAAPMVRRMAMLFALTDGRSVIEVRDFVSATAMWDFSVQSARAVFGDATRGPLAQRFLAAIEAAGVLGLTLTEIRQVTGSNSTPTEAIREALSNLREDGLVYSARERTKGRSRELWRHVQHRKYSDHVEFLPG